MYVLKITVLAILCSTSPEGAESSGIRSVSLTDFISVSLSDFISKLILITGPNER